MKTSAEIAPEPLLQAQKTVRVIETLKFVKKFCGQTVLIKIGGAPLEDQKLIEQLCEDLTYFRAAGISVVLVHGGGTSINRELERRQITWSFHQGLRVTTPEMMEVIESVLCGKVNGAIVRKLNASGVSAVGISGAATNLFLCHRKDPLLGEVGEVTQVNAAVVANYLDGQKKSMQGAIPVVAPMGVDLHGKPLNVNADWACFCLTRALGIKKVIYLTNQDGILNKEGQLISEIDLRGLQTLIDDGTVQGGMLTKVETIKAGLSSGVEQVHIINGSRPHSLIEEVFTDQGVGTICRSVWN